METKEINIAEILKDCPKEMKLYSPAFGELKFISSRLAENKPILTEDKRGNRWSFYPNGRYSENSDEVMLFPSKDQRDWNKFVKPVVPPFEISKVSVGDTFYFMNDIGEVEAEEAFAGEELLEKVWNLGNYFNTRKQAEYAAGKVKELLLSMRKEVSNE